jgi:hypothetical protein
MSAPVAAIVVMVLVMLGALALLAWAGSVLMEDEES